MIVVSDGEMLTGFILEGNGKKKTTFFVLGLIRENNGEHKNDQTKELACSTQIMGADPKITEIAVKK